MMFSPLLRNYRKLKFAEWSRQKNHLQTSNKKNATLLPNQKEEKMVATRYGKPGRRYQLIVRRRDARHCAVSAAVVAVVAKVSFTSINDWMAVYRCQELDTTKSSSPRAQRLVQTTRRTQCKLHFSITAAWPIMRPSPRWPHYVLPQIVLPWAYLLLIVADPYLWYTKASVYVAYLNEHFIYESVNLYLTK